MNQCQSWLQFYIMQLLAQKNGHWNQRETKRSATIYIITFYKQSRYASGKTITENYLIGFL